ncbi:MAG: D-alanine--D-alanine ligase [Methylophilaceae bacterium]|nr:D-alanine--D-alanine ligase [Methylophilaceae bacterium]
MSYKFGKVAVLLGGISNEREISLKSGSAVLAALISEGIDAHPIDPMHDDLNDLKAKDFNRVFICLHGKDGEDGKVQGILDEMNIPYTGSGKSASAKGMDKLISKSIWKDNNLSTPDFLRVNSVNDYGSIVSRLNLPFFVKPANSGSSIGINKVNSEKDFNRAFQEAIIIDKNIIAEKMIVGREYTLTIIGQELLPIIEIQTKTEFYDYAAKYSRDDTRFICPTDLPLKLVQDANAICLRAFNLIGCKGWGRVDFIIDNNNNFFIIEINSIPGMTNHSLVPLSAENIGISFEELTLKILETSCA